MISQNLKFVCRFTSYEYAHGSYAYCVHGVCAFEAEVDVLTGENVIRSLDAIFDIGERYKYYFVSHQKITVCEFTIISDSEIYTHLPVAINKTNIRHIPK